MSNPGLISVVAMLMSLSMGLLALAALFAAKATEKKAVAAQATADEAIRRLDAMGTKPS